MFKNKLSAPVVLKLLQKRIKERNVEAIFGESFVNPYNLNQHIKSLESNYDIREKLHFVPSKRSGVISKINNKIIYKLYWIIRNTLAHTLEAQQRFNKTLIETTKIIDSEINSIKKKLNSPNLYNIIDYHSFEDENRGSEDRLTEKQKLYLPYFLGKENVLDVGCGRGEFLMLLRDNGVMARGVEVSDDFVVYCQNLGLEVEKEDVLSFLKTVPDNSLGGLIALQVVEHLEPPYLLKFIKLAYKKLAPDAYMILETLNPQSLIIFSSSYFKDLTHKQPLHPAVLQFAMKSVGFQDCMVHYSSEVESKDKLKLLPQTEVHKVQNENIIKLNQLLFGAQDYAIIGKKI